MADSSQHLLDASGVALVLGRPPARIVSLIPSVTETLFVLGRGDAVVGCTAYCTEPREGLKGMTRVGGEKNPDLAAIRDLGADLVIANMEENRREDVEALRAAGIPVFVTYPRSVEEGIRLVRELATITGADAAGSALADSLAHDLNALRDRLRGRRPARVFYPIWRNPWMTINQDTYVHAVLSACGGDNVFAARERRYPEVSLDDVAEARPEVILLPDEPYRFRRAHMADFADRTDIPAVRDGRVRLVDGRLAAWYGPRLAEALRTLPGLLQ